MSVDTGVLVGRRSRAEIERLAGLYEMSGMGRSEFCRSHSMALSTLNRHLKKQVRAELKAQIETASRTALPHRLPLKLWIRRRSRLLGRPSDGAPAIGPSRRRSSAALRRCSALASVSR